MLNDKKVRFQHSSFRRQLQDAREYKRTPRKVPERGFEVFLSKIGLGSIKAKIFLVAGVLLVVYFLFVPNMFFVKTVQVQGLSQDLGTKVADSATGYMKSKFLSAQRNMLLLSPQGVSKFILESQKDVFKINSIKKVYPSTVVITAEPRTNKFLVQTEVGLFLVSGDGVVQSQVATTSVDGLIKVTVHHGGAVEPKQAFLPVQVAATISDLYGLLNKNPNTVVDAFTLEDLENPDITILTTRGYKIIVDKGVNARKLPEQLQLILSDVSEAQVGNIGYIDLRLQSRGFLCMKNTPCMIDQPLKKSGEATSTVDLIGPEE